MQAQYKSIFSEDIIAELKRRQKQPDNIEVGEGNRDGRDQFDVHIEGKEEDQDLRFYGDQMCFEYRHTVDLATMNATHDTRYSAQAEV